MAKNFRPYSLDQQLLLPPDLRTWLPDSHLALFIADIVAELDLSGILDVYRRKNSRGRAGYHPQMMVSLILYAYCTGRLSSRKIERATYEDVAFRVLSGDQHPDHDTIADFRQQHLQALAGLFVEVLKLCEKAGLVKLGHVAVDGTKVKANASKHKAMSYKRMCEKEKQLQAEMEALLSQAQQADSDEDAEYGKGRHGDELPDELARRESRLVKIREAKAALEQEAKDRAQKQAEEVGAKLEQRKRKEEQTGKKTGGRPPVAPDPDKAVPEPKAQKNFTDPESRIMKDGASKSFEQAYNAQAAVDAEAQVIVASAVTQQPNDKQQLIPMLEQVQVQAGRMPEKVSADTGYFSDANVTSERLGDVDLYIATKRQKHGVPAPKAGEPPNDDAPAIEKMRHKLATAAGKEVYKERKQIVEPVFGQIKEVRGIRRFSFRGLSNVSAEWDMICLTHNLLKLFRYGHCLTAT